MHAVRMSYSKRFAVANAGPSHRGKSYYFIFNHYRSSWVQRKEDQHQTRGPSIRGLVQPHPCPDDGVDGVFDSRCQPFLARRGPVVREYAREYARRGPVVHRATNGVFRKFVCIYLIVYSSIGSNGPFPLPKYCALPIASLDLIVCL